MSSVDSTKPAAAAKMEEEEEDYGVLIYRESQLRKAEAAAAAEAAIKDNDNADPYQLLIVVEFQLGRDLLLLFLQLPHYQML